jgi:hypothetical protein
MTQDLVTQSKDDSFHFYPVHFLMSVFDAAPQADDMIAEVLRSGVAAEDVHTWRDAAGARTLDADGRFHGWPARLWRWAERATGEHAIWTKYSDALRHGQIVVAFRCEPGQVDRFVPRLRAHEAHAIRYFGAGGIETISES